MMHAISLSCCLDGTSYNGQVICCFDYFQFDCVVDICYDTAGYVKINVNHVCLVM